MKNNDEKLSKLPYKGTNDVYPENMLIRNYLFDIWTSVAKEYGYEEYDTPLIEDANLYKVKSGEDLANNQLYSFTDKGGREIALRPEMTPSLARIIAKKKNELTFPLRWFNIGRYYRYEKPQRGRSREFFQLNIDILGVDTIGAELEIVQYVLSVMNKLNAPEKTYEIKVNSRYLLDYLFDEILKIEDSMKEQVSKAIDSYLKIDKNEFPDYLKEIGLSEKQVNELTNYLNWTIEDLRKIENPSKGIKDLTDFFDMVQKIGLKNVSFYPYIVRGLQYYTGIVFEMYDVGTKENPRAIFGGGRYDDLLEIFGEEKIPAFGLGWGDVTTLNYLKTYNLIPEFQKDIEVFVTLMDDSLFEKSNEVTNLLREKGVKTQMQLTPTKLSKQLKYASKLSVPWVIVIGEEEVNSCTVNLKDMNSKKQFNITVDEAINKIL